MALTHHPPYQSDSLFKGDTDQLGSIRAITDGDGDLAVRRNYHPFGEISLDQQDAPALALPGEDKGFVGERFDAAAGLQFLNARYYDPALGLFTSPDWFEVSEAGVGTNRYSYSFNDPVNLRDPGGNDIDDIDRDLSGRDAERARGNEKSDVDTARWQRENSILSEGIAQELYGVSFSELTNLQKLRVEAAVATGRGAFANAPVLSSILSVDGSGEIATEPPTRGAALKKFLGEYGTNGGHHVHAKAGFKGDVSYDPKKGFSVSLDYMNNNGLSHSAMTRYQRQAFDALAKSGKPNTMREHTNIAVEALMAGGASRELARSLVAKSLLNLRSQGVYQPSHIPWN